MADRTDFRSALRLKLFQEGPRRTYLLSDLNTKEAIWIDPDVNLMPECRDYLSTQRLKLVLVLGFSSASAAFAIVQKEMEVSAVVPNELRKIRLGRLEFHLSGSKEGLIFLRNESHSFLFSGSIHLNGAELNAFDGYPKETVIYPGYDESSLVFSTVEAEQRRLLLNQKTHQEEVDDEVDRIVRISVDKFMNKLHEPQADLVIDLREELEFQAGHIAGAVNIPIAELGICLKWISQSPKLFLICQSGRRSLRAAKTLNHVGFADVIVIQGGYQAWLNSEYPIAT